MGQADLECISDKFNKLGFITCNCIWERKICQMSGLCNSVKGFQIVVMKLIYALLGEALEQLTE